MSDEPGRLGPFQLSPFFSLICLTGPDHLSFFQNLTTNDIISLPNGSLQKSAILDKKSYVESIFYAGKTQDTLWVIVQSELRDKVFAALDSLHFAEELQIKKVEAQLVLSPNETSYDFPNSVSFPFSLTGETGKLSIILDNSANLSSAPVISKETLATYMLEAGEYFYGVNVDSGLMILELAHYADYVDFKKGCYPGQEIVARTHTQGAVRKKLLGLKSENLPTLNSPEFPIPLTVAKRPAGEIRQLVYSPTLKMWIASALLQREYAYPEKKFIFTADKLGVSFTAEIVDPPFYLSPVLKKNYDEQFHEGLRLFHQNLFSEAQIRFEKALELKPRSVEACEALALIYERLGQFEKAIAANQQFSELDGNAVMAHTNLSRLYMKKGWIEKAEKEKERSTSLGFRLAAAEAQAVKEVGSGKPIVIDMEMPETKIESEDEILARQKKERENKKALFEKVLRIDPDDDVALFGLGKYYFDTKDFMAALTPLKKVTALKPDFSMAFYLLGKTLVELKELNEAKKILSHGIETAKSQGDMMPQKGMEEILARINQTS